MDGLTPVTELVVMRGGVMKIRQSMTVGLILLTLISLSANETFSDSLMRQGYDAYGNLWGFVCNEYGQCQWVLIQPAPNYYTPPSKQYSPPPQNRSGNNTNGEPDYCNICEACMFGNKAACIMVTGTDCGRCKKVSESDNRNINRTGKDTQCSLIKMQCESICYMTSEYGRNSCLKKCESEFEKCIDRIK